MTGGLIRIGGNAGGQIGAAYRGSLAGMKGGTILVEGSAGMEIGMRMRRGVIAVKGPVRDFAGLQMKGGTIVLMGGAEIRTGAWMVRGTIVSLKPLRLLPTFSYACAYNPTFFACTRRAFRVWASPSPTKTRPAPISATRGTRRSQAKARSSSGSRKPRGADKSRHGCRLVCSGSFREVLIPRSRASPLAYPSSAEKNLLLQW